MANSNAFSAVPDLSLEEGLFLAFVNGPLEQNEGLLDALEEVDVRMLNRRTLLHNAVSLGKVDWVEGLLARGADPSLEDDSHLTALSSAEEMLARDPEDSDLRQVTRLVRMVHRRDQAMRRRLLTSDARGAVSSSPPVFLSDHLSAMAALCSSVDDLKEQMRSLTADLRSSLDELKEQVCGREELTRRLDAVVTSSIEDLTSLSDCLPEETTSETPLPPSNMAGERSECVDGMMIRTEVVYGGEEGVRFVRKLYERLYDQDVVTECLLKFLQRESRFVAKVDCDSKWIERMKGTLANLDGEECNGSNWISFAEFSTDTVYLGAKVCAGRTEEYVAVVFAVALAQMSFHLCFNNGAKPYEGGDNVREEELKRALEEAEEERRKGEDGLHPWIREALDRKTQTARESSLAASVPLIIASYGSNQGTSVLREQVPRLLHYFKEHVVATLLAKAGE